MKKPLTLSMKFSPLAQVPDDELEARHEAVEAKVKKDDPFNIKGAKLLDRDEKGKLVLPVTLRREDFLNKEFYLPNHPKKQNQEFDETKLSQLPVQTLKADFLNGIKQERVMTKQDGPVSGLLATFSGHTNAVTCCVVAIVDDEEFAFTGSMDCTIRVFSLVTGNCIRSFEGHSDAVTSLEVAEVVGTERFTEVSRTIKNTLNPRWGNLVCFACPTSRLE